MQAHPPFWHGRTVPQCQWMKQAGSSLGRIHLHRTCRTHAQHKDIQDIVFTEQAIRERIAVMGRCGPSLSPICSPATGASQTVLRPVVLSRRIVAEDFQEKEPLVIGTLNGAFVFMAGERLEFHPCFQSKAI